MITLESNRGGWRGRAACRSAADPETFFPTAEYGPQYDAQVAVAKAVCARCPVRAACLDEALVRIPYGIAGGLTPDERRGHRPSTGARIAERALDRGLSPGATQREVAAAGRVLLAAGRPIPEVAARCGVTQRTATRWATTAPAERTAARGGTGKGRGSSRALP